MTRAAASCLHGCLIRATMLQGCLLSVTGSFLRKRVESAPMKLGKGEALKLRIFVDRCIVEVFANAGRLALSRFICPPPGATGMKLYAKGGSAKASSVNVWDIMPTHDVTFS
jgi:sucrose-6-phosphate hydrolase SacC (GH32 family)